MTLLKIVELRALCLSFGAHRLRKGGGYREATVVHEAMG
jgi:hypothetical protein